MHPHDFQTAEQSAADSSGMCQQAGSASGFWKEDVAVLLLTSVAGIVLFCASQGFGSIIGAHFITLFCEGVRVHLLQSPLLLTSVLYRSFFFLFPEGFMLFNI